LICLLLINCKSVTDQRNPSGIIHQESNNIRTYLTRVAGEITRNAIKDINTTEDLEKSRLERTLKLADMLGLIDVPLNGSRPPLNVQVTGIIHKSGYRIEKLYYESLPGLYVPANLYVPDKTTNPVPAILYLCGHAPTQKVYYQAHARKFAQLGFVCLIVETIQWGEVRGEHWGCYSNGWFNWYSRGYNPAGVEVWNAIRGLDLLSERTEVDKDRMGVTGISGGGAISWFTAALDNRVKAVAPVCGASTLEAQICTRTIDGHCDCMMPVNVFGWDIPGIGALIAPRPLLIAQADRDGLNKIESVQEIYNDLSRIYSLFGKTGLISFVETPGGHSYHKISRERIFSFFIKYLMGKDISPEDAGDIDESPEANLSEDELRVYIHGAPADDRTKTIQDSFIRIPAPPEIINERQLSAFSDTVKAYLSRETFHAFPSEPFPLDPYLEFRTLDGASYGMETWSFTSEKDWRLKIDLYRVNPKNVRKPLMIVLRSPEEERWASESFISGLDTVWNIAYFEVRGTGETGWAPELQWHVRRASAWTGRTLASMRVYDLLRCLEFCRSLEGVDPERIGIAARDEMGVIALYAGLLDGKCKSIILKNPPDTQNKASQRDGRGEAIEMLNCLRITDVYQIPALIYPSEIAFIGQPPASYQWSIEAIKSIGKKPITILSQISEYR
jgi:cephalosporin-C deacetylase-like acetyl esterase